MPYLLYVALRYCTYCLDQPWLIDRVLAANALDQLERLLCGSGGLYAGGHVYLLRQPTSAFQLVVEGEAIMETSDKAEAFIALTMGHSVFNRKIGRKNKALCLFIQKVVLKIDDGSKLPGTVAKLCHELMA